MASGTIYGTTSNKYIDCAIDWSSSPNTAGNYSDVTAVLYYRKSSESTSKTYGTMSCSISIDGTSTSFSVSITINANDNWVKAATASKRVSHGSDGSKSAAISASGSISGTTLSSTSLSGTADLDNIPRASTITAAGDITLGNKCSVTWTPASTGFSYALEFSMGDYSDPIAPLLPRTTSPYTYTGYKIPLSAAKQIPNSKTDTMTAKLWSYSDDNCTQQVGSVSSKTFTVTVPDSADTQPDVEMTLSPVNPSGINSRFDGLYIQGKSKLKAALSATGKYGATISSYSMNVGGKTYGSDSSLTSGYLTEYGSITVTGSAKDSRGITGSKKSTITVIAYTEPKVVAASGEKAVVAARCDADGNLSDSGTYLKIKAKRSYSPVKTGDTQNNYCTMRYRYKLESDSSYSAWVSILPDSASSDEVVTEPLLGSLDTQKSYVVQVGVVDDIGSEYNVTIHLPTDKVYMHRDKERRSLTFGGYIEEDNCFCVADDIATKLKGDVSGKVYGLGRIPQIQENSDFNDYLNFGRYGVYTNAIAKSLTNCPSTIAGTLTVSSALGTGENSGTWKYIIQDYITYECRHYTRRAYTDDTGTWNWSSWYEYSMSAVT